MFHELPTLSRRALFQGGSAALATAAMASLCPERVFADPLAGRSPHVGLPELPHHRPKAKRVISLFQSGGPSQIDLFDEKPKLREFFGQELPDSIRAGQRLTGMTADNAHPVAPSTMKFAQHGECGMNLSELLPHTSKIVDELCLIRTLHTEAINHDPAITFCLTGTQQSGRPSMGAWTTYGLGSDQKDLPAYVVMISLGTGRPNDQPLYDRLWGSGFLPTQYQGVKFRPSGDPVPFLGNPPGMSAAARRDTLDAVQRLNALAKETAADPEIEARMAQFEMAYRMQTSVPELVDLSDEPEHVFDLYGPDSRKRGTYAHNCLLARRLLERGVRFVQLFHRGWDNHRDLPKQLAGQCGDTDQASAALVTDLRRRGLLDDTLVFWGGEFGRTVYCQEELTADNYGRDHHPRCFSVWMAGAGVKGGLTHGETDDFSYNVVRDPISMHDLHATMLHLLGIDHKRLTFPYQGRRFRLTDVHGAVVDALLA